MFEAYAFLMLSTCIPTTIFSLITLIERLNLALYSSVAFILPGILFSLLEIVALTHSPSKIHASVSISKKFN